jgi:hypothetical protein
MIQALGDLTDDNLDFDEIEAAPAANEEITDIAGAL